MRTCRQLIQALRAVWGHTARQQQQLNAAGVQAQHICSSHLSYAQSVLALQHQLWAQQLPWQQCSIQQQCPQPWPGQLHLVHGYAAPARALADSMAEVAERKLADMERQCSALETKLEGVSPSSEEYQQLIKELKILTPIVQDYQLLQGYREEAQSVRELIAELKEKGEEQSMIEFAQEELENLESIVDQRQQELLLALLPKEESEEANVVLEIRPSMGGEWAGGFAADLLDMYRHFAAEQGWRFEILESKPTDLGGIKSATAFISGSGAYGQLRWESGVHRATMVPENDKHGRMHTGTAVVVALPEASEVEVKINESDLRIETCRASGKGGQHVNTTDSAVRIVHLPTGIVVTCQNERSQVQNKMQAMRVLRTKLHEQELERQAASLSAQRKAVAGLANANERIRSYNYQDGRVSDHRVGLNLQIDVMRFMTDGQRLGELIQAVKLQHQQQQLQELLEEES